ncbi:DUF6236 family protein [Pseudomonas oryzihabitans]|uniref:DUF6236 family protein n=1 Tax=Pseudomonas oryzihabitans TaxID=47885 RepID=UPI00214E5520|nr:DUF6236 family protein [Pseudomonas psychrotolerans]UUW72401.1 DUF6236 family protein [Pseudomonas psychrotolerans]
MIHVESGPDESFLEQVGTLSRPRFQAFGDMAQGIAAIQFRAFEQLDTKEPGSWAMAQGERSLLLIGADLLSEGNGITVQLHRAIPIPNVDVPLAEILEFKQRRRDELIKLRHNLEFIKSGLSKVENGRDALNSAIAAIDQSCSELLRCGTEWQFPMRLSDLEFSISFNPFSAFGNASAGWIFGQQYGLPVAAAAAAAMSLQSCLSINRSVGFRSFRRPETPFRYAYLAHKELL